MAHWNRSVARWLAGAITLAGVARASMADTITLKDGRKFSGDVIEETQSSVTLIASHQDTALTLQQKITKSNIAKWDKPAQGGPSYVRVPVLGEIGRDTTTESIRAALEAARATHPAYLVLVIDSDGGRIDEMTRIIDLVVDGSKDYRTVAYVKKAYSAAAVIAMACKEVYMAPGATIGAVVPFKIVDGAPADVDAKFRSALQAKIRATAEQAGHADLIMRGMSEMDLELYVNQIDGKPVVSQVPPGKKIKSRGEILSLTAGEAVEAGLAQFGTDLVEVGKGVTGGRWYESSAQPWNAALGAVASQKQKVKEIVQSFQKNASKRSASAKAAPVADGLERQITTEMAKATKANKDVEDLEIAYAAKVQRIKEDYEAAIKAAPTTGSEANIAKAKADEDRKMKTLAARKEFHDKADPARDAGLAALQEISKLRGKQAALAEATAQSN